MARVSIYFCLLAASICPCLLGRRLVNRSILQAARWPEGPAGPGAPVARWPVSLVGAAMETDSERLRNDALARDRMQLHMEAVQAAELRGETGDRGAWKWAIRKRVWDYMEEHNIAANPRPVHHRIPNFVGAELTARQVISLPEFGRAQWIKVNPDSPQREVRAAVLRAGKMLLVPQPRLRTGFFSVLNPSQIEPQKILHAVTQEGVKTYGKPIGLEEKIKIDMVVIGSVAVNPANGARLGKGEGFAELEYGMLRWMGAIDDDTPVVTCIHDCQLVSDIPSEKMLVHDVPVDIICTPTQIIRVNRSLPKPQGIYWEKLSPQKLASIKILQQLKAKIEHETGQDLPQGPEEILPPTAVRSGADGSKGRGKGKQKSDARWSDPANASGTIASANVGRVGRRWVPKEAEESSEFVAIGSPALPSSSGYAAASRGQRGQGATASRRWQVKTPQPEP